MIQSLADLDDRPALQDALARRGGDPVSVQDESGLRTNQETIRRRAEMVLAVDEGIGRIVAALDDLGILDETLIVFTSDNGYFYGEHGLTSERRMPYEDGIRNPLVIRYPPAAPAGATVDALVSTVDLAPSVLDLAGAPIGPHLQGRTVAPLLADPNAPWREAVLVEFYTYENPFNHLVDMDYRLIRTDRYKYIHWMQHPEMDELYDLANDPFETDNRVDDPGYSEVRVHLREELGRLVLAAVGLDDG
jgi:arylsulfatase A-like enzyme